MRRRLHGLVAVLVALLAGACSESSPPVDASVTPGRDAAPDAEASNDAGPRDTVCVGVRPAEDAWTAEPGPLREPPPDGGVPEPDPDAGVACPGLRTCVGAEAPVWALTDFQPQSCGQGATYGLDVFRGKVTVVALLAAW